MKGGRWVSLMARKFKNPDGSMNWRVIAAATYATSVWTILGMLALAYKQGHLTLTTESKEPRVSVVVDRKERSRIIAEDVAENKYTPENFIG